MAAAGQFEFLRAVREIGATLCNCLNEGGWTREEHEQLYTSLSHLQKALAILDLDAKQPWRRKRRRAEGSGTPSPALTVQDVARRLGLKVRTVYARAERLDVGVRVDGKYRFDEEDVLALATIPDRRRQSPS